MANVRSLLSCMRTQVMIAIKWHKPSVLLAGRIFEHILVFFLLEPGGVVGGNMSVSRASAGHVLRRALPLQVAFYLIDLLQDSNAEVVKAADQALTVISETDESWAAKLRALKFEAHNQVWLEACANGAPQQVKQQ